jgi:hypothetical protein
MVDRNPETNIITFTASEQDSFNVPPELTPEAAVKTATVFIHVAAGLVERAATFDPTEKSGFKGMLDKTTRAIELGSIATRILDICPAEHLALIASAQED